MPLSLATGAGAAETIRVATFHTELSERGPGLLLAKLAKDDAPDVQAVVAMIAETAPDVLLLQGIDYDAGGAALSELARTIAAHGPDYAHRFALRPNAGTWTGLDLDGNGRTGEARDAQGYGRFAGDGGMAILSRYPVLIDEVVDLSTLLWRDMPGAIPPPMPDEVSEVQRLSSTAHWIVPVQIGQTRLDLMAWHATVPVFDGPEDRNGRRARDETAVWLRLLDGALDAAPPTPPFVIAGIANIDPEDGEGPKDAIRALLGDPRVTDPEPASAGGRLEATPGQEGDPALDTVAYGGETGGLRVSVVLPSRDLEVAASGVLWPAPDSNVAARLGEREDWPRHRLVWVDLELP